MIGRLFSDTIRKMSEGKSIPLIMRGFALLVHNPKLLFKKIYQKIKSSSVDQAIIQKKVNEVFFEFDFSFDPWIKEMYLQNYEIEVVELMKRILKPGDNFIDVGANIGYLTAIGTGLVGKEGEVHIFEPVPRYFKKLEKLVKLNPEYKIILNDCALGDKRGSSEIYIPDPEESRIGWDTMIPGHLSAEIEKKQIKVPVQRLDQYIANRKLENITLIKIDVEGFEFPILKGLANYFESRTDLPAILCEIVPSAYPRLNSSLVQLSEYMNGFKYNAYSLYDPRIELDITKLNHITNVVFKI